MPRVTFTTKAGKQISFQSNGKKKRKRQLGSGLVLPGQRGGSIGKKVGKLFERLKKTDWKAKASKAREYGNDLQSGMKQAQELATNANQAYAGLTGKESEGVSKMIGKMNDASAKLEKARGVGDTFAAQYGMGRRRRRMIYFIGLFDPYP